MILYCLTCIILSVCHIKASFVGHLVLMCCCVTLISSACEVRYKKTAILKNTTMEEIPAIRRSIDCATECQAVSHCQGFVHKDSLGCHFISASERGFLAEAEGIESTEAYMIYLDNSVARGKIMSLS